VKRAKVRLSEAAAVDILEQADWYKRRSGVTLARRWDRAVATALIRIARNPRSGAPCNFEAEELRAIRRMPLARFPKHLIFYQLEDAGIVVLRVVHGVRDLESLF
jgi:toxin ParE1/3/4